ncbi:MAG: TatD family hydrolase [Candidatus Omnitrophica bacterium]|nr:TatD family hydrolase [Candidatus Omnitrophota bacterium]
MFIDTHCHLDFPEFDSDRNEVIQRAKAQGIDYIINVGSSLEGSRKSIALAKEYAFIYAAAGIHPHEADNVTAETEADLRNFVQEDKVVAIGEIGLDYFKHYAKVENQKRLFVSLLGLARDLGLPVIIHCRDAQTDILKILKATRPQKVVVHCFSGEEGFLRECLDLGFFISYTGNITYKKADKLRILMKLTPLEHMMLETDAPFLAPEGWRGKRNEPLFVKLIAEEISRIKGISVEEVARVTAQNAKDFFNLP